MGYKITLYFNIIDENLNPEEITNFIGVKPTGTWNKGDIRKNTKIKEPKSGWEIKISNDKYDNLNDYIINLLEKINHVRDRVKIITEKYYSELGFSIYSNKDMPEIFFSNKILKEIIDLNLNIDIDIYNT